MTDILQHVFHMHNNGFREVYYINDESLNDRFYLFVLDEEGKRSKLIQLGPKGVWFSKDIPWHNRQKEMDVINGLKDNGDYRVTYFKDRAKIHTYSSGEEISIKDQ